MSAGKYNLTMWKTFLTCSISDFLRVPGTLPGSNFLNLTILGLPCGWGQSIGGGGGAGGPEGLLSFAAKEKVVSKKNQIVYKMVYVAFFVGHSLLKN